MAADSAAFFVLAECDKSHSLLNTTFFTQYRKERIVHNIKKKCLLSFLMACIFVMLLTMSVSAANKNGKNTITVECPEEIAEQVADLISREMEQVASLKVPLLAEAKWGKSWYEAK